MRARDMPMLWAALVWCPSVAAGQDVPALSQSRLGLDLRVDFERGTVEGTASLTVTNEGLVPVGAVPLQLGRLMSAAGAWDARGRPLHVSQDVLTLEDWPELQLNQLSVRLVEPIPPAAEETITLRYEGIVVPYTETGMRYVRDHVDADFTLLRAEAMPFPVIGVPHWGRSRSMPARDFLVELSVTVPPGVTVATGFEPTSVDVRGELQSWHFESPEPIPFLNVAIAPYEEISSARGRILHFPVDAAGARRLADGLDRATSLYERWFGPAPPGRLTIMEIPEGWGSQAHRVAGIIQTADAFRNGNELPQLYHELAHIWHPRDTERPAPRWNEGLATFLQHRVADALDDPGSLEARMEGIRARVARAGWDPASLADLGKLGLTDRAYTAGALFFYVLFRVMGEMDFDAAVGGWMTDWRATGSTTADLVSTLVEVGGPRVQRVVDEWMYGEAWLAAVTQVGSVAELVSHRGR